MKDTHFLCCACGLALLAILAVFVGYATDTLPVPKGRVIVTAPPPPAKTEAKKKDCFCCAKTMQKLQQVVQESLVDRRSRTHAESQGSRPKQR